MVPMYKKGGKKPKSSFMEKSKEIKFGEGGLYSAAEKSKNIAKMKKMNGMQGPEHQTQVKKQTGGGKQIATPTGPATPNVPTGKTGYMVPVIKENQGMGYKKNGNKNTLADKLKKSPTSVQGTGYKREGNSNTLAKELQKKKTGGSEKPPFRFRTREERQTNKLNKTDKKIKDLEASLEGMSEKRNLNIEGSSESELGAAKLQQLKNKRARIDKTLNKTIQKNPESKLRMAKTGGKSMEPGGGGRFAALVSKLKGKGKSEGSAKAIAASIGRKKYGKSKFQEMAAKGKKGLGGASDSTGSNEAGMQMIKKKKNKK